MWHLRAIRRRMQEDGWYGGSIELEEMMSEVREVVLALEVSRLYLYPLG